MNKNIEKILKYFSFFSYAPSFEEIYTFYPEKITKKKLKKLLLNLEKKKKIISFKTLSSSDRAQLINHYFLNTVGEYSMKELKSQMSKRKTEFITSQKKLSYWRFRLYIKLLSFFPQIKLVGLSGSIAMMNAKDEDDIDLFIITSKKRLFTARFIAIILAKVLGIHRKYQNIQKGGNFKNKVCLNLFFDESNIKVPDFKKTEFIAHEVLQMKPLVNKDNIYERFLKANQWVLSFFPNSFTKIKNKGLKLSIKNKNKILRFLRAVVNLFGNGIESLLKRIQFFFINRHRTTEIITSTQLWFHPDDFEKKIKKLD